MDNLTKKQQENLDLIKLETEEKVDKLMEDVFDELCRRSNEMAKEKGFWDDFNMTMDFLMKRGTQEQYNVVKSAFVSQKLALIASEASEAINALRKKSFSKDTDIHRWNTPDNELDPEFFAGTVKDSVQDELADTVIRIFDFCGAFEIDLFAHIKGKMKYNATRRKRHGAKF